MRFASVGPKWCAALQSSLLLSPSLPRSLSLSLSLERGPACCLSCSHRRGAAAQTAGMHQMHRTDRCPSRSTGFHLFTSDPVARARVFLSRPLAFLFSTPFHLALPRASSSTVHSDSNGERVVLRYYFSCSSYPLSPRLLFPSAFPSSPSLTFLPTRFFHYSTPVRPFTPSLSLSLSLPPSASRPTVFLRSRQPSYLFSLRRNVIGISLPHSLPVNPFLLRMTSLLLFFFFFFSFLDDNYFFIFIFIRIDKYRIELRPKSNSIENLFSRFPKI